MTDTKTYIKRLEDSNPLREPVLCEAIRAMQIHSGTWGLDAGCGIGLQALLLAEAVGPVGHVTGLDRSPQFLLRAEEIVGKSDFSDRISFQEGNISNLPFDDHSFDWVWSADCVGYPTETNPLLPLRELARVVRPGGLVAILAWSSQKVLPGYPLLEARLDAMCSTIIPYVMGRKPEQHFVRALGWLQAAGFEDVKVRTLVGDLYAPLSKEIRNSLISFFQMLWVESKEGATKEDWAEYQRLCQPDSPDFILDRPDYYAFFTYSMFLCRVPD